jgi:ABC-type transport system involved in multi-copper enzyme maturation permease subunit
MTMFRTIVRKEFLDHVMSFRFSALFVITTTLMVTGVLVFSSSYEREMKAYPKRVETFVDAAGMVNLAMIPCMSGGTVRRLPSALAFCADAGESELPNQVGMAIHGIESIERSSEVDDMLGASRRIDWVFVISTVLTFGAGLLTYKSVSGELRDGTLSLLFSNPVPRGTVLLGKYAAALAALSLCFSIAMLVSLIALQVSGGPVFGGPDWAAIILFWVAANVTLSVFVLIGLACSVFARSPLFSAVAFLFVWVGLVFVIPSLGGILAGETGGVMTPLQVQHAAGAIRDRYNLPAGMDADRVASVKLDRELAEERLLLGHLQSMVQQVRNGQNIARLSPAAVFTYAAGEITGGGLPRLLQFVDNAVRYREGFFAAILEADRQDPESAHRYVPWWCGGNPFSTRTVDPGPAKQFRDVPPSVADNIAAGLWDLLLLALYNLLAFAVAFTRFLRADVVPAAGQ